MDMILAMSAFALLVVVMYLIDTYILSSHMFKKAVKEADSILGKHREK